jgi:hypothetical protein
MKLFVTTTSLPVPRMRSRLSRATDDAPGALRLAPGPRPQDERVTSTRLHVARSTRRPSGRLVDQIGAGLSDDPGPGGWSGGVASQAHWDPGRPRAWRCWAQSGPTWAAHCGAEVVASDPLGLCHRHRSDLLERDAEDSFPSPSESLSRP